MVASLANIRARLLFPDTSGIPDLWALSGVKYFNFQFDYNQAKKHRKFHYTGQKSYNVVKDVNDENM